jgi:hypothetical protein
MRATLGRPVLTVRSADPLFDFFVYRIVRSDAADDPVLINSFRSNFDLGGEPRKVERESAVIHMGISVYLDRAVAAGTARRSTKLGDFVAQLHIRAGLGLNFAETGHPLHLTMWGDPIKLSQAVADITPVER